MSISIALSTQPKVMIHLATIFGSLLHIFSLTNEGVSNSVATSRPCVLCLGVAKKMQQVLKWNENDTNRVEGECEKSTHTTTTQQQQR
jgi:hypothetical protein